MYKKAIELDENNIPSYLNWGIVFAQKGEYDEAIKKFQKVIELAENHIDAHHNWGVALSNKNEFDKALVIFQRIIQIDSNNIKAKDAILELKRMQNIKDNSDLL